MSIDKLIYETIGAAFEVYNTLGPGFLESVYEKAMIVEFKSRGLSVQTQFPVEIEYSYRFRFTLGFIGRKQADCRIKIS